MRKLRIAPPAQLRLGIAELAPTPAERWWSLPTVSQEAVVAILARMITAGVVVEQDQDEEASHDAQR